MPDFYYLRSILIRSNQAKNEITILITVIRNAFLRLTKLLWTRCEITIKTKFCSYIGAFRTVLLYNYDTWPIRAENIKKLLKFYRTHFTSSSNKWNLIQLHLFSLKLPALILPLQIVARHKSTHFLTC